MQTSLAHLAVGRQRQLSALSSAIIQSIHPEKIILFGFFATAPQGMEDPECVIPGFPAAYDLLVVTRSGDRRYDYEIQDIIVNRCGGNEPVTVLVHDIDYVNRQLTAGHYFFSMLGQEAILLYDAGHVPLAVPVVPDLAQIRVAAKKDFERWWSKARAFFTSSLFNMREKEWKVSVFLLHQAAENAYQAILLTFTGYKPCTHNLDKLRRYTNRFSIELGMLFPRNTPEEDRLFKLLLQGYVDARYKEDYQITKEDLGLLVSRIGKLLSIAVRICRNRFISLEKMAEMPGWINP